MPGATTFCTIPWTLTAELPTEANAAPISPPISAWLELDGIVKYQAMRFQMKAPMSAAPTTESAPPPRGAGADRRRHRVGGVVKPVCEVEGDRHGDHDDQYQIGPHARWRLTFLRTL